LRISSYGQTLAMWYDPTRGSAPIILQNFPYRSNESMRSVGRFAFEVPFRDPKSIAVDSGQMLYVADDDIVRRFASNGIELTSLGVEGIQGSAFPGISTLRVLDNDRLAVVCNFQDEIDVYFYDREGKFLYVCKLTKKPSRSNSACK